MPQLDDEQEPKRLAQECAKLDPGFEQAFAEKQLDELEFKDVDL